jgi:hypothetical protein
VKEYHKIFEDKTADKCRRNHDNYNEGTRRVQAEFLRNKKGIGS